MKRLLLLGLLILLPMIAIAAAVEPVETPPSCQQCGMDRTRFAQSRMLVIYVDGTKVGVCSINCAVAETRSHPDQAVKTLLVADYATKKLIDARSALWVVGGQVRGVMTAQPKWAFSRQADAQHFIQLNGGEVTPFATVLESTNQEVAEMAEMLKSMK